MAGRRHGSVAGLVALAADPASGVAGDAYFNTTSNTVRVHNGTGWRNASKNVLAFTFVGTLSVKAGVLRIYNDSGMPWIIEAARAYVNTAPTGASAIFTVKENGTSAFTLTVAAAGNTATATPATVIESGNYLTVDVTQIGSTVAGADATIVLTLA